MGQRSISVAELKAECINLERATRAAGLATETDLAPHRPGGAENNSRDARAWLRYYAVLHRRHARVEASQATDTRMRADAAVLAALRDEPIRVTLVTPVPIGQERTMASSLLVYPKSLDALLQAHALDRQIAWLLIQAERVENAGAQGMPRASQLHEQVMQAIAYAYGLLVWIMTSPTPGMPYKPTVGKDPELPAYVAEMNPMDYPQIAAAAQQHHARIAAVQELVDRRSRGEDGGRRPSWSQFIGSLAIELDENAVDLACFRSLGALLASVQLDNDAKTPRDEDTRTAPTATHPAAGSLV